MSMPKAPTNETAEYIEDKTFENVPASLHLGNDLNIYLTPEQDMEDREDINDEHLDYLGDLDDGQYWLIFPIEQARKMPQLEEYFYRSNSPMSMWMSNHREWKDDRQHRKDAAFRSYTLGIWEFNEELWQRYNTGYQSHGSVLHDGGCRASPNDEY
ncbi:hypothetical protein BDV33DRAFT_189294 [Aspergillus novoparasiticus]|uniref:Uncharacterized protein n=2 Tax=Aspergillus subgen. Circumdati TaxID=2720871 RepID=A0A5N6F0X5_9EURO|nr:hypothetical protein BDV33DRAFT_189294 [Aspergillus novoparasiticus]